MFNDTNTNTDTAEFDTQEGGAVKEATSPFRKLLKKKKTDDEAPQMDMLAFASVMTILLAFFIMLSSFAGKPKEELAKKAIESFKEALENFGMTRIKIGSSDSISSLDFITKKFGVKFNNWRRDITGKRFANLIDREIEIEYLRKGQQLIFPTNVEFINGGLELTPQSKDYLNTLTKMIKDRDCTIMVNSYTDKSFVPSDEYPTSWQFSAERAAVLTNYLNKKGDIDYERLTATGYGKYQPLLGVESAFRAGANNRINIIVSNNEEY